MPSTMVREGAFPDQYNNRRRVWGPSKNEQKVTLLLLGLFFLGFTAFLAMQAFSTDQTVKTRADMARYYYSNATRSFHVCPHPANHKHKHIHYERTKKGGLEPVETDNR